MPEPFDALMGVVSNFAPGDLQSQLSGAVQDPRATLDRLEAIAKDPTSLVSPVVIETGLTGPAQIFPSPDGTDPGQQAPNGGVSALPGFGGWLLRNVVRPKITAGNFQFAPYGEPGNVRIAVYASLAVGGFFFVVLLGYALFGKGK